MRGKVSVLLVLFVVGVLCVGQQVVRDWPDLIRAAKPAVVLILAGMSSGSGAVISPDGYILTAAHVIEGARSIAVQVDDAARYDAVLVQVNYDDDIAVLKIQASGLTWLALGDSADLFYEQDLRALGYPTTSAGAGFVSTAARIEGFRTRGQVRLIQFTAVVNPGNSGGPLIDRSGRIVGVVSELWSKGLSPLAPPTPLRLQWT